MLTEPELGPSFSWLTFDMSGSQGLPWSAAQWKDQARVAWLRHLQLGVPVKLMEYAMHDGREN